MSGRKWTEKELRFLEKNADKMLVSQLAQSLKRSRDAVALKMSRTDIKSFARSTDLLHLKHIADLMGIQWRTVNKWRSEGLPVKQIGYRYLVDADDLIKFLKKRQDLWDVGKVPDRLTFDAMTDYAFKDMKPKRNCSHFWTPMEIATLKRMHSRNKTAREIGNAVGRSEKAVRQKMFYLRHMQGIDI